MNSKPIYKSLYFLGFGVLLAGLYLPLSVKAATFIYPDKNNNSVNINTVEENLYVTGNIINVEAPVKKDLLAGGNTVNIDTPIERNLFGIANTVTVRSQYVGASSRIIANEVYLSGNFNEDVVILANKVTINNAVIKGDLVVNSNDLSIQSSVVRGGFYGHYTSLKGDLNGQVNGQINATQHPDNSQNYALSWLQLSVQISTILGLLLLVIYLRKRRKLESLNIVLTKDRLFDFVIGLGLIIIPAIFLFLSILLQLYPLVLVILIILILLLALSNIFVPVYLSSLIKNTFGVKIKIIYLVPVVYLSLLILNFIPFINYVTLFLSFITLFASFGYLIKKLALLIDASLKID